MVYDSNGYLSSDQQTVNAQYIANFFIGKGWMKESISAMLGNMESESSINFGIYEGLDSSSSTNGFGLVQWTPNTKYFDWASSNGYSGDHVNGELNRILYEVSNSIQWIPDGHYVRYGLSHAYDISFNDFVLNTGGYTAAELADAWMWNYEGPANPDQPDRGTQATTWYNTLDWTGASSGGGGGGGGTTPTPTSNTQVVTLLLCGALNGW